MCEILKEKLTLVRLRSSPRIFEQRRDLSLSIQMKTYCNTFWFSLAFIHFLFQWKFQEVDNPLDNRHFKFSSSSNRFLVFGAFLQLMEGGVNG